MGGVGLFVAEKELNVNVVGNGLTIILRMIGRDWTDLHSHSQPTLDGSPLSLDHFGWIS